MQTIRVKTYNGKNIFVERVINSKSDVLKIIRDLKEHISGLRSDLMSERLIYQRESKEVELMNAINYYNSVVESLEKTAS